MHRTYVSLLLSLGCFVLLSSTAAAQQFGGQSGQMQQQQELDVTSQQLQAAAEAFVQIQQVQQQFRQEHGNMQDLDSTQVRKIQRQFQQETRQIVMNTDGISPALFSRIIRKARTDQAFQQRFAKAVKAAGGNIASAAPQRGMAPSGGAMRGAALPDFSAQEIQSAAQAYVRIQEIRDTGGSDVGDRIMSYLQNEASISRETFTLVMYAARVNPQVRQQVLQAINQAGGNGGSGM